MDARKSCLHPYRKRKFFHGLAELLQEAPPPIRRIEDVFPGGVKTRVTARDPHHHEELHAADKSKYRDDSAALQRVIVPETESSASRDSLSLPPGQDSPVDQLQPEVPLQLQPHQEQEQQEEEEDDDSFEFVEFDRSRASLDSSLASSRQGRPSQSSMQQDSMQDSLLFLPAELRPDNAASSKSTTTTAATTATATVLRASLQSATLRQLELLDYFDLDRYTEITPCWAFPEETTCGLHREAPRRPMLLFCLQALDEFIALQSSRGCDGSWVTESCRLARTVFAVMWEADVLGTSTEPDISLPYTRRQQLRGVSSVVWRVLDECWLLHRAQFLHQQELFFPDSGDHAPSRDATRWSSMRELLHVYGLKPSQAARLIDDMDAQLRLHDMLQLPAVTVEAVCRGYPSTIPLSVGVALLQTTHATTAPAARLHRNVISQSEWKLAFRALELHVRAWSNAVDIFPCGAFSRGAAFGSVLDVLIALPEDHAPIGKPQSSDGSVDADGNSPIDVLLAVLQRAKIIETQQQHHQQQQRVWRLTPHRALAIIRFKTAWLVLDLKVYTRPQSWFALLYFTGPERFSRAHFELLLQRPLTELREVTFDCAYPSVVRSVGVDAVSAVASEKDVFDLVHREYLPPSQRF
ncbi:hypothetical protein PINS_up001805 [Pythium insidiosum]|nr:hypothetical protein PINS_up001805 [Pythium insidiosum]